MLDLTLSPRCNTKIGARLDLTRLHTMIKRLQRRHSGFIGQENALDDAYEKFETGLGWVRLGRQQGRLHTR